MKEIYESPVMIIESLELNEAVAACHATGTCHTYTEAEMAGNPFPRVEGNNLYTHYSNKNHNTYFVWGDKYTIGVKEHLDKYEKVKKGNGGGVDNCTCFQS